MRTKHAANKRNDRGAVLLIATASLGFLLAMTALVVDLGDSRQRSRENQSVSDMASTSAAIELSSNPSDSAAATSAHGVASDYVERNLGSTLSAATCSVITTGMQCYTSGDAYIEIQTPYAGILGVPDNQQIWVNVCSQSAGFFGPAVGLIPGEVCRDAIAVLDETIILTPAILALDPTGPEAFHLEGAAQAVGDGGSLVSNSNSSSGFHMKDSTFASTNDPTGCICSVGGVDLGGGGTVTPTATANSTVVADPWASLVEPTVSTSGSYNSSIKTFSPGSFGGVQIDQSGTYTFLPGIYEFTGEFKIEGSGVNIVADNVLWFLGPGSSVNWGSGTNNIRISARPSTEYYGGDNGAFPPVAIFQSRSNSNDFNIGDNIQVGNVSGGACSVTSSSGIVGGIYLPVAELRVRGNNNSGLCTEGAPVVAWRVQIQEDGFVQGATDGSAGASSRGTHLAG